MGLTSRMRTTIVIGLAVLAAGLTEIVNGIVQASTPHAHAGASLTLIAVAVIGLTVLRTWICDTRKEREELAATRRNAEAEHRRYIALKASLMGELARHQKDRAAESAHAAQQLAVERAAMEAEFEERRLENTKEAFRMGVEMERSGQLSAEAPEPPANLIQFPTQEPAVQPERSRERSREHGYVSP